MEFFLAGRLRSDDTTSRGIDLAQVNEAFTEMKSGAAARRVVVFESQG